jgi:hypothetical protein
MVQTMYLEESNYKTGVERWTWRMSSPEPPRQTSSATPPIGEFCVVMCNNDFINYITHNSHPPFAFQRLRQRRSKDTEALEVTLRKESRVCLSPPFCLPEPQATEKCR